MAIKFAEDIVKEIRERGNIEVPEGYVTGEAFEEWLYKGTVLIELVDDTAVSDTDTIMPVSVGLDFFPENYGEAA